MNVMHVQSPLVFFGEEEEVLCGVWHADVLFFDVS